MLSYSCRKNPTVQNPVYAGKYDDTYNYIKFSPVKNIQIKWDSLNFYGFGSDSIDLDQDGIFDMIFELALINEDSLHLIDEFTFPLPYFAITPKNQLDLSCYYEYFYVGLNQTVKVEFLESLSYNDRIDTITNWLSSTDGKQLMWDTNPGFFIDPSFGKWYDAVGNYYLGIRINGKYGWIEIDNANRFDPLIKSYAFTH